MSSFDRSSSSRWRSFKSGDDGDGDDDNRDDDDDDRPGEGHEVVDLHLTGSRERPGAGALRKMAKRVAGPSHSQGDGDAAFEDDGDALASRPCLVGRIIPEEALAALVSSDGITVCSRCCCFSFCRRSSGGHTGRPPLSLFILHSALHCSTNPFRFRRLRCSCLLVCLACPAPERCKAGVAIDPLALRPHLGLRITHRKPL